MGQIRAGPKLGAQKIQKIKILKIKIRSAQNVGKVWISRKKNLPAPFGALAAIHPWWGHKYELSLWDSDLGNHVMLCK